MSLPQILHFNIHYATSFGQAIFITGKNEELGSWHINLAKRLSWSQVNKKLYINRAITGS
jgi:hypothetical protein